LQFILGDGKNMYDFTYVENVAHAHVCAEQALDPAKWNGDDVAAGKVGTP
jgi:sterol-4alpha-carboxylate 3-dehydrogenase (decarboxylating)